MSVGILVVTRSKLGRHLIDTVAAMFGRLPLRALAQAAVEGGQRGVAICPRAEAARG